MKATYKQVFLGDIAEIFSGGTPSRSNPEYWNGNIPWIKTAQIQNSIINEIDVDEWITNEALKKSSAKIVSAGTILMAMYGQGKTRGQVAILSIDASINQACVAIQLKNDICRDYIYQFLLASYKHIRNMSNTGGQENLTASLIREIPILLPPLPEQKAIADLLSTWDEAIEKTERLIQAKEMHFQWLLQELISKPQKNKKWKKVKLGDICKIASKEKLISVKGHFLLTVKLHCLGIERNDRIVPKLTKRGRPYFQHKSGDFLIGRQNFHNGGFGIIPSELNGGITSNAISCLIVNESKLLKEFLFFQFSNPNYYRKTENIMDGTGQKELSDKQILKLNICLPKIEEQKQIAETLSIAQHEINLLKQLVDKYKIQKRGLMQKMLTDTWRIKPEIINQYKEV
ncbi:MAG TPA: restriction endonuclease subunit S [Planctomycetota bacterium]|nr:restriction endonuclease subunit S [Planctomycetota bacterium]